MKHNFKSLYLDQLQTSSAVKRLDESYIRIDLMSSTASGWASGTIRSHKTPLLYGNVILL